MKKLSLLLFVLLGSCVSAPTQDRVSDPVFQNLTNRTATPFAIPVLDNDATGNTGASVESMTWANFSALVSGGGATSGVIDFEDQGGTEGSGATTPQREANWTLLKTLEGTQDSNSLEIFFPGGDWYFQPTIDPDDDVNDPWGTDHVEADAPVTLIRGAGKDATTLHFPNRWYYYIFRQRAWDAGLVIRDLTITTDGYHSQSFTADAATDKLTANAHGFTTDHSYLKFTSDDTLPEPLDDDTQSSVDRVAVVHSDANTFFVKNWITTAKTFTIDAGADTIDIVGHGWSNGELVVPSTQTGDYTGTAISAGTRYFIVNANTDDFQISLTSGGAAINLTGAGTGTLQMDNVYDITTAGVGTHTFYEIGDRAVLSAGYHTGATSGIDGSDGTNYFNTVYDNCRFEGISPFAGVSSKGAKNLYMHNCEVYDVPGVGISSFINDTGTEGVDWARPSTIFESCTFSMRTATKPPYGNHHYYGHPTGHQRAINSIFLNCYNNAFQIQSESSTGGAGGQLISNCYFKDNESHIVGAQSEDDRSRLVVDGCSFDGIGACQFRGDVIFSNNFVRGDSTSAIVLIDETTDDTQRKETYLFTNNTFIVTQVSTGNAFFSTTRDDEMIVKFQGNIWRRDPSLSVGTQIFLGQAGSSASDTDGEWYFTDEVYEFDTTGAAVGWFLYPAKFYEFRGIRQDGPEAFFITVANTAGTEVRLYDCIYDAEDASGASQKAVFQISHTGWSITGARNRFDNGAWIDNPAGLEGTLLFGEGRNPTDITAAATVYIDPSYHTHNVSGTTTIDTITIGVTGNVAADAAADNPDDMWTGSIVLLCPSGLTLSAAGNIANGPYTTTSVDAVRLHWQTNDTWIIEK